MEKFFSHPIIDKTIESIFKTSKGKPYEGIMFFDRENLKTVVTDGDRLLLVHSVPAMFHETPEITQWPMRGVKMMNYTRVCPRSEEYAKEGITLVGIDGLKCGREAITLSVDPNGKMGIGYDAAHHNFNLALLPDSVSQWRLFLHTKNTYPALFQFGEIADYILMPLR